MDINDLELDAKLQEYMNLVHRKHPAVLVLRAMKLLTISGVPLLTGWRIRIVCDKILNETSLVTERVPWEDALAELKRLEFVSVSPCANGDVALTIRDNAYFGGVVIDYPSEHLRTSHRAKLLDVLTSSSDSDGLFYVGTAFNNEGRYDEALDAYDRVLNLGHELADITYFNRGVIDQELGRYFQAIVDYESATMLNPSLMEAWNNMGGLLSLEGRYDEANDAYEHATSLAPTNAALWYNSGRNLARARRHPESVAAFQRALALDPLNPQLTDIWAHLGLGLALVGDLDDALVACERAIDGNQMVSDVWHVKAAILQRFERKSEALEACNTAIELDPRTAGHWRLKASILRDLGRVREAYAADARANQLGA